MDNDNSFKTTAQQVHPASITLFKVSNGRIFFTAQTVVFHHTPIIIKHKCLSDFINSHYFRSSIATYHVASCYPSKRRYSIHNISRSRILRTCLYYKQLLVAIRAVLYRTYQRSYKKGKSTQRLREKVLSFVESRRLSDPS